MKFSVAFLSFKANIRVKCKRGTAGLPQSWRPSAEVIISSHVAEAFSQSDLNIPRLNV
jgi:hypothetical protein